MSHTIQRLTVADPILIFLYVLTIPSILDSVESEEVQERDPQHAQRRMGYSDIHPERQCMHLTGDEDILDQFAQVASDMDPSHDGVTLPPTAFIHLA
jgi:hypothetical protein